MIFRNHWWILDNLYIYIYSCTYARLQCHGSGMLGSMLCPRHRWGQGYPPILPSHQPFGRPWWLRMARWRCHDMCHHVPCHHLGDPSHSSDSLARAICLGPRLKDFGPRQVDQPGEPYQRICCTQGLKPSQTFNKYESHGPGTSRGSPPGIQAFRQKHLETFSGQELGDARGHTVTPVCLSKSENVNGCERLAVVIFNI